MDITYKPNTLYYGDCLEVMRSFPSDSIDLIYLDPPFNSDEKYHTIFEGSGLNIDVQIKAFDDMWLWDADSEKRVQDIKNAVANPASKVITAFELCIPETPMLSYTSYMAQRLFEMRRVLKDTGSIYLHCDPTASHYLKLVMDAVFEIDNFRNEIIWRIGWVSGFKTQKRGWIRNHDTILYYVASKQAIPRFNKEYIPYAPDYVRRDGKKPTGKGYPVEDTWNCSNADVLDSIMIKSFSREKLGYPTQKTAALLERIIIASSNPGDVVLDPFAGCGTTIEAACKNNRLAIGIDILPFALRLINSQRLVPNGLASLPVQGIPVDMDTAKQLARNEPFKFQDWAISLIDGFAANPKKIGDDGIDGFGVFFIKPDNMDRKAIVVQVTGASGSQRAKFDRLQTTIVNNNAAMGVLITLDRQTARRNWSHNLEPIRMGESTYEPIQCFSIEDYYKFDRDYGAQLRLPPLANPWTGKAMQKTLFD
ncbi:MAG: site-specific DNA-methyltransferase [Candidatus Poribacteria bacterium]|nr:site-specific DNA-methyltransferase [Candidatus Poribacteria bacterium]